MTMTFLLKLFSKLFGYDYGMVSRQTTVSKQKIVTLGTLLLIPVILWTFSGYYLARHLLGTGGLVAFSVAVVLGGMILIIDRSFIATPKVLGVDGLKRLRISFAVIATLLGSLVLDLIVFSGDLEEFRKELQLTQRSEKSKKYTEEHSGELARLASEEIEAKERYDLLQGLYLREMDGSGGTGKFGIGPVARAKQKELERSRQMWETLQTAYRSEKDKLEIAAEQYGVEAIEKRSDALLSKVEDLHAFIMQSWYRIATYLLFMAFVFLLETTFIYYKSKVSETLFEQWLFAEEAYGSEKLKAYRARKEELSRQDGLLGYEADRVRTIARSPSLRKII